MAEPRKRAARRRSVSLYLSKELSPAERAEVLEVARLEGIETEIALLRVLIWKAKEQQPEEARRQIEALCRALRLQHLLSGSADDNLSRSLARVLDEMGAQLEAEP